MNRARVAAAFRLAGAIGVLALIVWRLGTGPFVEGLRVVNTRVLLIGVAAGAVTTLACAWRWQVVARQLGTALSLPDAVAACYRSVFLNSTLPGGVVGDVHRAMRHGRSTGDLSRGARSVAWERTSGQVVQLCLTLAVLLILPSPARGAVPYIGAAIVLVALVLVVVTRGWTDRGDRRVASIVSVGRSDLRALAGRESWPVIVASSAAIVVGHAIAFAVAARTAGVSASVAMLAPLTLLVLAAMAVPVSFAGWGLREGAAAWAFDAAGLGASAGVTTAVIYGVMSLVGSLPGALVLLAGWRGLMTQPGQEALHG